MTKGVLGLACACLGFAWALTAGDFGVLCSRTGVAWSALGKGAYFLPMGDFLSGTAFLGAEVFFAITFLAMGVFLSLTTFGSFEAALGINSSLLI